MATTKHTDRDLWQLPALNVVELDRAAAVWVADQLVKHEGLEAKLRAVSKIIDKLSREEEVTRVERDELAVSVARHWNVRRGCSMDKALGLNRTGWRNVRERMANVDVPEIPDAPKKLPKAAEKAHVARRKAEVARTTRDEIVTALLAKGLKNVEIATLIHRDPSRVSHIKNPKKREPAA